MILRLQWNRKNLPRPDEPVVTHDLWSDQPDYIAAKCRRIAALIKQNGHRVFCPPSLTTEANERIKSTVWTFFAYE